MSRHPSFLKPGILRANHQTPENQPVEQCFRGTKLACPLHSGVLLDLHGMRQRK